MDLADLRKAATKRRWDTTVGVGDKQARLEANAGSAQDPNSPTDLLAKFVDDEMNSEMEVDGSEKRQTEQTDIDNGNNMNRPAEIC